MGTRNTTTVVFPVITAAVKWIASADRERRHVVSVRAAVEVFPVPASSPVLAPEAIR